MSFPRQVLPGRTYLVTRRCTQRQFLLRPDPETNNAFVYCLAYAAIKASIDVVAYLASANHYHAVVVDTHGQIPKFLELFHKLFAKHQNQLRGRRENMWSSQQTSLVQLEGPDDILAKVAYTLTNPVKDFLVDLASHWPGATSLRATLFLKTVRARRPARFFDATGKMPKDLELRCVRAPGFQHLSDEEYREHFAQAIHAAELSAESERRISGRKVFGRKRIRAQSPFARPEVEGPRRPLNPSVAARSRTTKIEALRALKEFRSAYADARKLWLTGADVRFPVGTWWLKRFAYVQCVDEPRDSQLLSAESSASTRRAPMNMRPKARLDPAVRAG